VRRKEERHGRRFGGGGGVAAARVTLSCRKVGSSTLSRSLCLPRPALRWRRTKKVHRSAVLQQPSQRRLGAALGGGVNATVRQAGVGVRRHAAEHGAEACPLRYAARRHLALRPTHPTHT
jgi:hypothetical protein